MAKKANTENEKNITEKRKDGREEGSKKRIQDQHRLVEYTGAMLGE